MNGEACRRLLDNTDVIFTKIQTIAHERIEANSVRSNPIKHDELDKILDKFLGLFQALDLVFSLLQILDPNQKEIENIEMMINQLDIQWKELQLKETPKLHILVTHTVEQVKWFGRIPNLAEDFVEKSHQIRNCLNHLMACMSSQCYRNQELVKFRKKWLMTNPLVQVQIAKAKESSRRRNCSPSSPTKKFKKEIIEEIKTIKCKT